MFGSLHTLRRARGLPAAAEVVLPAEGRSAAAVAEELELPLEGIEAVFCNHRVYALDHVIRPGDVVAFVPPGTPGPHRYSLGIRGAGLETET